MKDTRDERSSVRSDPGIGNDHCKDPGHSTTVKICRQPFTEELPLQRQACLEVIDDESCRRNFELVEEEYTIGRSPDSDIQLRVDNVSRLHSRIVLRNEEYHIEDMESTNGTYVNGIRVMKCALREHDLIEVGGVKMIFHEEKRIQEK